MASGTPLNHRPEPASGVQGQPPVGMLFDPQSVLGAIVRRKIMISGLMLIGLGLSLLYIGQLTSFYSASATILLDTGNANITNIEGFTKSAPADFFTIETTAAVIESRDIVGKVVDRRWRSRRGLEDAGR